VDFLILIASKVYLHKYQLRAALDMKATRCIFDVAFCIKSLIILLLCALSSSAFQVFLIFPFTVGSWIS
jgi:hypothetical protein